MKSVYKSKKFQSGGGGSKGKRTKKVIFYARSFCLKKKKEVRKSRKWQKIKKLCDELTNESLESGEGVENASRKADIKLSVKVNRTNEEGAEIINVEKNMNLKKKV